MKISKRQADLIVENMKSVVKEDINFITDEGMIISSTDPSRVGSLHTGALKVVKTRRPLEVHSDNQYEGTLKGLNLPVFYEDDLVAVVGITGEVEKIRQYSKIIVTMSEILIKEHFLNRQKEFQRENNRMIMELITKHTFNPNVIRLKMEELGFDKADYKRFIVFKMHNLDQQNIELANRIYNSFEKRIHINDLLSRSGSKYLLLTQTRDMKRVCKYIEPIKQHIERKYNLRLTVGISEEIKSPEHLYNAFQQADMVTDFASEDVLGDIVVFDPTSLDFFLKAIPFHLRREFSENVLKGIDRDEKESIRKLLKTYVEHNGKLNACAEALYIHKNTLQYRLNRIAKTTHYNPRNLKQLIILYIALSVE